MDKLVDAEALQALRSSVDLSVGSDETLGLLAAHAQRERFSVNQVVFSQGDSLGPAYLVTSGYIRLTSARPDGGSYFIGDVGPTELLGEMTALTGQHRLVTATALGDVEAWRLDADLLRDAIRHDQEISFTMLMSAIDLVLAKDAQAAAAEGYMTSEIESQRKLVRKLEEVDRLKNELIAMTVHDLRNPIAAMAASIDALSVNWDVYDDEQRRNFLEISRRSATKLTGLVSDMLQIAQIESGTFHYDIKPFDVGVLARESVNEISAAHGGRKIEVTVADGLPDALGDRQRYWQVFTNLLANAVKFSSPQGLVQVDLDHSDGMIEIRVRDEGAGISAEHLDAVFEKFWRSSTAAGGGSGLGLFISKAIVENQKGRIGVESEPGVGSTFWFTIPAAGETASVEDAADERAPDRT